MEIAERGYDDHIKLLLSEKKLYRYKRDSIIYDKIKKVQFPSSASTLV